MGERENKQKIHFYYNCSLDNFRCENSNILTKNTLALLLLGHGRELISPNLAQTTMALLLLGQGRELISPNLAPNYNCSLFWVTGEEHSSPNLAQTTIALYFGSTEKSIPLRIWPTLLLLLLLCLLLLLLLLL